MHLSPIPPLISRMLRRTAAATLLSAGAVAGFGATSALASPVVYVSASAKSNPTCANASKLHPFQTIAAALGCAGFGETVSIGAGTFAGGFTVPNAVLLEGAGANKTTISDATHLSVPEVTIAPGAGVHIQGLTVSGGAGANAGITAASGSLTLDQVAVDGTYAQPSTGPAAVSVTPGPSVAYLTINDSTISNNNNGQEAGGVAAGSASGPQVDLDITNSTITGNSGGAAGGVFVTNGSLELHDDTITDNGAGTAASGVDVGYKTIATIGNNVIADEQNGYAGPDCAITDGSVTVTDDGHNLIGAGSPGTHGDCGFTDAVNGDLVGTPSAPLDPQLGPLAANGGTTRTQAPLPGSPVIDAGSPSVCQGSEIADLDQRGDNRAAATRLACDIGAYDTGGKGGHVWNVAKTKSTPTCATASATHPFPTIAGALACVENGDTVKIAAGTFAGGVTIPANVILQGAGATKTTITDASSVKGAEINLAPEVSSTIEGLTVNGHQVNSGIDGASGNLVINHALVTNAWLNGINPAPVSLDPMTGNGSLTLLNSTISNSEGDMAGGVYLSAAITQPPAVATAPSTGLIANSTISGDVGNQASGGIEVVDGNLDVRASTVAHNTGTAAGGLFVAHPGTALLIDTLLATNTTSGLPGTTDCAQQQGTVIDDGHNLIGVAAPGTSEDCKFVNGNNNDLAGSVSAPLDPDLGPLANNGGPTPTQALLSGSPAIGAGNQADCDLAPVSDLDQRGVSRQAPGRGFCDIGAYDTGGA